MPGGIETTPLDELTRLPLPLLISGTDYYSNQGIQRASNYHHHFHPEKSTELGYDSLGNRLPKGNSSRTAGLALRFSRGQDSPIWLHDRYHEIFEGPPLPQDSNAKFTAVVLSCAGVIPREAIDLHNPGSFEKVMLNDKQHDFIRRKTYFEGAASFAKRSKRDHIGKFIAEHALQSSLSDIMTEKQVEKKVAEFLRPRSESQRIEAGRFILGQVIDASIADLIPIHREAEKEGMVKEGKKNLGQVVLKFFTADRFPDYFDPLEDRLSLVA